MKFKDSKYYKLKHYQIERPFGDFYLLENFFVSELNEGVHFDWEMIKSVMDEVIIFYGLDSQIGYISNRTNSYSIDPQTWNKVDKEYGVIVAGAIVTYNTMTFMNATLEKQFYKKSIKRCLSLDEAIEWISNLKELKNI
ncbi:hypothetical protein CJ739_3555 [Mariniflexile rhizosphaerae]|uniref:hypothetical protein n=1 Tax=unclassified Mariniflexile TaxID=2643887 RepID=UPI000CB3BE09|nr:hypothetical protein [Mariniflexile sp. TRM1-10]AXP82617.1 hypothetical protein CJ739_3555 [Mariniflexile sp. TRM1-10]PLB18239.1 MAG: hypothetical protein TRG1_2887 [Flavobacteriaceae bacterium FS1-H7996/R]